MAAGERATFNSPHPRSEQRRMSEIECASDLRDDTGGTYHLHRTCRHRAGSVPIPAALRTLWSQHAPVRHKHRNRYKKPRSAEKEQARHAPNGPLQIVVSIADQRIAVYDNGALIARSSVSTGVPRHPTPMGVFSVIGKKRWHRSNLYSAAPMPYMQRLTWSGIALHAGVLPGYPASHGCIRLKRDFAVRLWQFTRRGTRIIITSHDTRPLEISNPRLFAANPKALSGPLGSSAASADNAMTTAAAVKPSLTADADRQHVADPKAPGATRSAVAPPKVIPISVFVSRKLGRLFVRQGSTPLFDSPVRIQAPEEPLGTHVFTVMKLQDEGAALRWTVVSMPENSPRTLRDSSGHRLATRLRKPAQRHHRPTRPTQLSIASK